MTAQQPKNPDCEMASKGYVKCIARKLGEHTHDNFIIAMSWAILALIAFAVMMFCYPAALVRNSISGPTIIITLFIIGVHQMGVSFASNLLSTSKSENVATIKAIQKYTPPAPVCEKKKECEE